MPDPDTAGAPFGMHGTKTLGAAGRADRQYQTEVDYRFPIGAFGIGVDHWLGSAAG